MPPVAFLRSSDQGLRLLKSELLNLILRIARTRSLILFVCS